MNMTEGYMSLVFPNGMEEPYLSMFLDAREYWNSALISAPMATADMSGFQVPWGCLFEYTFPEGSVYDGVVLLAEFASIDGESGILAQAGVCTFDNNLPRLAVMQFDADDAERLTANGNFDKVIKHEMAHSYGLGSAWANFGLTTSICYFGFCQSVINYTGVFGMEGLAELGGSGPIVVETGGGGTVGGTHWSEGVYMNELMTGYLDVGVENPVSIMSMMSFMDMGYEVNLSYAEAYSLPKGEERDTSLRISMGSDVLDLGYRETSDWLENGDAVTVHRKIDGSTVIYAAIFSALTVLGAVVAMVAYKKHKRAAPVEQV